MITTSFTQADIGGTPKVALPAMAPGGIYAIVFGGVVVPGAGAGGFGYLRLSWTDAEGLPHQTDSTFFCNGSSQPDQSSIVTTLAHPSNLTLQIVNGAGATGLYTIDAHTYVTRAHEEG